MQTESEHKPPTEILNELKTTKKSFPDACIYYNAHEDKYFVSYFSSDYYNSMFMIHIETK